MMNFNEMKTTANVKAAAREMVFEKLLNFFKNELGDSNVSIIGANEIAICVGYRNNSYGKSQEVCVVIKPTAKDFENRKTTKKSFVSFDRIAAENEYKTTCENRKNSKKEEI